MFQCPHRCLLNELWSGEKFRATSCRSIYDLFHCRRVKKQKETDKVRGGDKRREAGVIRGEQRGEGRRGGEETDWYSAGKCDDFSRNLSSLKLDFATSDETERLKGQLGALILTTTGEIVFFFNYYFSVLLSVKIHEFLRFRYVWIRGSKSYLTRNQHEFVSGSPLRLGWTVVELPHLFSQFAGKIRFCICDGFLLFSLQIFFPNCQKNARFSFAPTHPFHSMLIFNWFSLKAPNLWLNILSCCLWSEQSQASETNARLQNGLCI